MTGGSASLSQKARIAVDLGAESCRVSLLRYSGGAPHVSLVHRFAHGPVSTAAGLCWDLQAILSGVDEGLSRASLLAPEGFASIGVDGWAVDYVRLSPSGDVLGPVFCYRDARSATAEKALHRAISPDRLRALTGVQLQSINTLYQQHADVLEGRSTRWLNLPEYVLFRWGGRPVAEFTNATHTGMLGLDGHWCADVFQAANLRVEDAPPVVLPGTDLGDYRGQVEALQGARLIAPCCHDTASAVAAIADDRDDWAYISSGTWSLIGTVLDEPCISSAAAAANFTNLGAAGGRRLFHKGIPGMWLLQQCLREWPAESVSALVAAASEEDSFDDDQLLNVLDSRLSQPGNMPELLNEQRKAHGLPRLDRPSQMARLLFQSLAAEYGRVLRVVEQLTGKTLRRVYIIGGGSQNELLNHLTAQATGLAVSRGMVESSTFGNFALQMASASGNTSAGAVRAAVTSLVPDR